MPLPHDTTDAIDWVQVGQQVAGSPNPEQALNMPNIPMGQLLTNIFAIRDARSVQKFTGAQIKANSGSVTLTKTPFNNLEVDVFYNGSLQEETTHYTISGKVVIFTEAFVNDVYDEDIFVIKSRGYNVV